MQNGASTSVEIVVTTTLVTTLSNSTSVTADTGDPDLGDNNDSETTTVDPQPGPQANLSVTKVDALDPVTVGDNLVYTITVVNSGPDSAQNVVLTDDLPGSVVYVSGTPDQGSCSQLGGIVTCDLGEVQNGASTSVEIVVTPTIATTLTNNVSVAADTGDPDLGDNNDSELTDVELSASFEHYLPLIFKNKE
jgi:uncharacterized repeat protein (TIGR01451 family)